MQLAGIYHITDLSGTGKFTQHFEKAGNIVLTALCAQTQTKKNLENVALQRFQDFSCGSFDR
ncbi:MAG: hypothetical protein M1G31_14110 [Pseudanabaena sp. Salubria-1]|nr:hypothetical protein [Pseudanabaena sp. Salubria-1]